MYFLLLPKVLMYFLLSPVVQKSLCMFYFCFQPFPKCPLRASVYEVDQNQKEENNIILFFSNFHFYLFTFLQSKRSFMYFLLSPVVHFLWSKSTYVFFTLPVVQKSLCIFYSCFQTFSKCPCGHYLWSFNSIQSTS